MSWLLLLPIAGWIAGSLAGAALRLALRLAIGAAGGLLRMVVGLLGDVSRGLVRKGPAAAASAASGVRSGAGLFGKPLAFVVRFAPPTILFLVFGLIALVLGNPYTREGLDQKDRQASTVEVFDADGLWLGAPGGGASRTSDGPRHVSVPLYDIPPVWRSCVAFLEDRGYFGGLSGYIGIDPAALVASAWQTLTLQQKRGASTLTMQVFRTLHGQSPDHSLPLATQLLRKVSEFAGAPELARMLRERDQDAAARIVGTHLALMSGLRGSGFGEDVHGVVLAGRVLFGKPPARLTFEEQAILAAAVKAPIAMAPPGHPSTDKALSRWQRVKQRADHCLASINGITETERQSARRRLAAMPLRHAAFEDRAARAIVGGDATEAWRTLVNPLRRANRLAATEIAIGVADLERAMPQGWRGSVVSVRLTLSIAENRRFVEQVKAGLAQFARQTPGLTLPLGTNPADARVVVSAADANGRITRLYASHPSAFRSERFALGSTAKVFAGVVLSATDTADTPYCRSETAAEDDELEAACEAGQITATQAFARSDSSAIRWALEDHGAKADIDAMVTAFRLPMPVGVAPSHALAVGLAELSSSELMQRVGALGAALIGANIVEREPQLLKQVTQLVDGRPRISTIRLGAPLDGSEIKKVVTPRRAAFLRDVLAATSRPGGTLARMGAVRPAEVTGLYAKTGTVSKLGTTFALQIAGSYVVAGKSNAFVVTIASPGRRQPLGRKLEAGRAAAIAALVVNSHASRPALAR